MKLCQKLIKLLYFSAKQNIADILCIFSYQSLIYEKSIPAYSY